MRSKASMLVLATAIACAPPVQLAPPAPALPFAADTLRPLRVRPGITHWFIYAPSGPWAINVLDVERGSCYSAVAVKGAEGAVGREKTSALLERIDRSEDVIGGVNADFFLFAPPGVPTGAHISRGRVVTGPSAQPVLAFDSLDAPHITALRARGSVTIGASRFDVTNWNHRAGGLAFFDANWGRVTDTASSVIEVALGGRNPSRVLSVDTTTAGIPIPADGAVLVARVDDASPVRSALLALKTGDTVRADISLEPFRPLEAVGGRPVLVRDSVIVSALDAEDASTFVTARHPRTAVGIGRNGARLLLVVVDGRQKPYSDGMTLCELAHLMLALGARDAINLDGGGSTAMVYSRPDSAGVLRVANRPSDATGERAVGNALAIVNRCLR